MRSWLTSWIFGPPSIGVPVVPSSAIERLCFVPAATFAVLIPCYLFWIVERGLVRISGAVGVLVHLFAVPAILAGVGLYFRAVRRKRQGELEDFRLAVDEASAREMQ